MSLATLFQPGWKWCAAALLAGVLAGAYAGWWVTDKKLTADIAQLKVQSTLEIKAVSDKAASDSAANSAKEHQFANEVSTFDQQHSAELAHALSENAALRDNVIAGTKRLRFAKADLATCQLTKRSTTSASSMVDATAVELSSEAGRDIYDIRSGIISDQQKLKYLQDYIRSGQKSGVISQ